jgi:hypothetical protein
MLEPYTGMRDILFGYDEDIYFSEGDLFLTTGIDYIEREVYKLLITNAGEWRVDQTIGCSPCKFVGEPNTRDLGKQLEQYVKDGLKKTIYPGTIDVRVVPVNYTQLVCLINIFINTINVSTIPFEFDFQSGFKILNKRDEKVMSIISSQKYIVNDISNTTSSNKYWSRMRS